MSPEGGPVRGVVFDLDGVVVDTEHLWTESWVDFAARHGVAWTHDDSVAVMGMSAPEWSRHLAEHVSAYAPDAAVTADEARGACVDFVVDAVRAGRGPLLDGARALVEGVASLVPVALASSAARPVIETVLDHNGLQDAFCATVSSEEVARGKPSPDVYTEAVRRLDPPAGSTVVAVEDSGNGIRAAHAAGLHVVALPNPQFPPPDDALALSRLVAADHHHARTYVLSLIGEETTR